MSDGPVKAEFADRIDKLTELAECERQVQAAAHRFEEAERALVSAAEDLQEWSNQWDECRQKVLRSLPESLTADALTWYGLGSRLADANAFIRRYCDAIEARHAAYGKPALTPAPEPAEKREKETLEREIPERFTGWLGDTFPEAINREDWIEILLRSGGVHSGVAGDMDWEHSATHTHPNDIVAYRVLVGRDDDAPDTAPEDVADDASEFAESEATAAIDALVDDIVGAIELSPDTVGTQTYMDGDTLVIREITADEYFAPAPENVTPDEAPALNPSMHDDREEGYQHVVAVDDAPPTDPDADAAARGYDYYSRAPEIQRSRFSIFGIDLGGKSKEPA